MENVKIKVNSEAESNEVWMLLESIGLEPVMDRFSIGWIACDGKCFSSYPINVNTYADKCKEITIDQLRDMVVLKRNDVGDANFEDENGDLFYKTLDGKDLYRWFCGSHWASAVSYAGVLKPIKEKQAHETEYLLQGKNGEKLLESVGQLKEDNVNHPSHYCGHPSGIECIEITRHHGFAIGNAIKYLWRAGLKDSDNEVQDLKKAVWYIQDKIKQLESKNVDDKTIDWIDEDNK